MAFFSSSCMVKAGASVLMPRVLKCVGTAWNPLSRMLCSMVETDGTGRDSLSLIWSIT